MSVQVFTVADNGFRLRLAFAERERLQHHEEVQPVLHRELLSDLQNVHIVLGDTHRVEALQALKLAYVPVYYIEYLAVIGVPPRSRKVIQRIVITSRRLPSKTTHPIVHSRTLIVDFPITNRVKGSFIKKKRTIIKWLKKRRKTQLSTDSVINGQRYEEALFVFGAS